MKVRILSGNAAGTVQELRGVEAEWAIQSGFGEKVDEVVVAMPSPALVAEPPIEPPIEPTAEPEPGV